MNKLCCQIPTDTSHLADQNDVNNEIQDDIPDADKRAYHRWSEQDLMFHLADFYGNTFFVAKDSRHSKRDYLSRIRSVNWTKIYRSFKDYDEFDYGYDSKWWKNKYKELKEKQDERNKI